MDNYHNWDDPELRKLREQRNELLKACEAIRQWDMLDVTEDGPYWKKFLDEVIKRAKGEKMPEEEASFTFRYLMDRVPDWNRFCDDVGLNPWCINEGRADSNDTLSVPVSILKKHGILNERT